MWYSILFAFVLGFLLGPAAALWAVSRLDIPIAVDRFMFYPGLGHFFGMPTSSNTSNADGSPIDGKPGWVPGALWINFKSTGAGSCLYTNIGTTTSSNWLDIA
jgi:hypothetical protein